jgi:hypothetical protein
MRTFMTAPVNQMASTSDEPLNKETNYKTVEIYRWVNISSPSRNFSL